MRINTSTYYAIRMMLYLAEQNRIVSSTELSGSINISKRYSMQIIAKLRDGGLIGTTIRMSGGYALLKEPSMISLYDILMLMEGIVNIPENNDAEAIDSSKLHDTLNLLKGYVEAYLRSMTLDKLIGKSVDDRHIEFVEMVGTHITALKQKI